MNGASLLVLAVVLLAIMLAIAHLIHNRRTGKTDCGCGCAGCSKCASPNVELPDCCKKDE